MPTLSELGDVLHEEHFRILVWMCDLKNRVTGENSARPLRADCDEDRRDLRRLLVSLDQVYQHHAFEEDVLFPLIRHSGDESFANYLADGHAVIDPLVRDLRLVACELLEEAADEPRWTRFCELTNALFLEMMSHLVLEEMLIVQRLPAMLDVDTDRTLAHRHSASNLSFAAVG